MDDVDYALLRLLQDNNQQTVRELAEQVGVSAPTCLRRVRALRKSGVIRHDASLLDPAKLGLGLHCYVEIALHLHSAMAVQTFARHIKQVREVLHCSEIAGSTDFLLHVIVRDMAAFSNLALTHLGVANNVKNYRSMFVIREHKDDHRLPLEFS